MLLESFQLQRQLASSLFLLSGFSTNSLSAGGNGHTWKEKRREAEGLRPKCRVTTVDHSRARESRMKLRCGQTFPDMVASLVCWCRHVTVVVVIIVVIIIVMIEHFIVICLSFARLQNVEVLSRFFPVEKWGRTF